MFVAYVGVDAECVVAQHGFPVAVFALVVVILFEHVLFHFVEVFFAYAILHNVHQFGFGAVGEVVLLFYVGVEAEEEHPLVIGGGKAGRCTYAVGSALFLTDGFGVDDVHDLFEHRHHDVFAQAVFLYTVVDDIYCRSGVLHGYGEVVGYLSVGIYRLRVGCLALCGSGERSNIFLYERFQFFGFERTDEVECIVGCIGRTFFDDFEDAVVVGGIEVLGFLHREERVVAIHGVAQRVGEDKAGCGCIAGEHVLYLVAVYGIYLFVFTYVGEGEVNELEHRL